VLPDARGRGPASAAIAAMLDRARRLGVRSVVLDIEADNVASLRVAERLGAERREPERTEIDRQGISRTMVVFVPAVGSGRRHRRSCIVARAASTRLLHPAEPGSRGRVRRLLARPAKTLPPASGAASRSRSRRRPRARLVDRTKRNSQPTPPARCRFARHCDHVRVEDLAVAARAKQPGQDDCS
jgi:Acetyltransferase (GNAT) family